MQVLTLTQMAFHVNTAGYLLMLNRSGLCGVCTTEVSAFRLDPCQRYAQAIYGHPLTGRRRQRRLIRRHRRAARNEVVPLAHLAASAMVWATQPVGLMLTPTAAAGVQAGSQEHRNSRWLQRAAATTRTMV